MRRICGLLTALLAPVAVAAAEVSPQLPVYADSIQVVDNVPFLMPVDFDRAVRVRFPVGELEIVAADVAEVRTELGVRCERLSEALCAKYRNRLRLEGEDRDGVVEVRLVGLAKWKLRKLQLDASVTVPRWAPLEVRVGIGDIEILAGDTDLEVKMGIGDLTIRVPEERVGSVHAATRIGDASLKGVTRVEGRRRLLLGARVDWAEGSGPAAIDIGLKIGDASVVLE